MVEILFVRIHARALTRLFLIMHHNTSFRIISYHFLDTIIVI